MTAFDPSRASQLLTANKTSFGADSDEYLAAAISRLKGGAPDDQREATKLAVETAKMILTISVGVLVAVGTFFQFAHTGGVPWVSFTNLIFCISIFVLLLSMTFGFNAISQAYKRADGRITDSNPAWATAPLSSFLNKQAGLGIAGLIFLIIGIAVWASANQNSESLVSVSLKGAATSRLYSSPLIIDGACSNLRLKYHNNQEIRLPSNVQTISISCNW